MKSVVWHLLIANGHFKNPRIDFEMKKIHRKPLVSIPLVKHYSFLLHFKNIDKEVEFRLENECAKKFTELVFTVYL